MFTDILAQNPNIEVSGTSVLHMLMMSIRKDITCSGVALAEPQGVITPKAEKAIAAFLRAYKVNDDKHYIDKGRAWPSSYEFLERIGLQPKIVMLIRDIRDCYASFEKLYRKGHLNLSIMEQGQPALEELQGLPYRMELIHRWTMETPINAVRDLLARGLKDKVLWIRYEDFAEAPMETMQQFYAFTEIPSHVHDFDHIEHVTHEDDRNNGIVGLHDIESKLHPATIDYVETLGQHLSSKMYLDNKWFFDEFYRQETGRASSIEAVSYT